MKPKPDQPSPQPKPTPPSPSPWAQFTPLLFFSRSVRPTLWPSSRQRTRVPRPAHPRSACSLSLTAPQAQPLAQQPVTPRRPARARLPACARSPLADAVAPRVRPIFPTVTPARAPVCPARSAPLRRGPSRATRPRDPQNSLAQPLEASPEPGITQRNGSIRFSRARIQSRESRRLSICGTLAQDPRPSLSSACDLPCTSHATLPPPSPSSAAQSQAQPRPAAAPPCRAPVPPKNRCSAAYWAAPTPT